ncbi:MAG: stage III sporulation protein AF [Clostridia bacterium]|nr:stage III sporulation protein AF [Clostridia bacterium]
MKEYVLAIAGVVLLSAVVSIIAPSGKMGKFIKGAMRLAILVVLISPFAKWIGGGELSFSTAKIGEDGAYLSFCAERLSEEDEKEIESFLKDEFDVGAEVQVKRKTDAKFSYQKISVKIFDFGIIGQDEHIDTMSRIQETLQAKYGCLTEVA